MKIEKIRKNAPEGATHIDKDSDYWKVISDDESYFMNLNYDNRWVKYLFKASRAFMNHNLKPL